MAALYAVCSVVKKIKKGNKKMSEEKLLDNVIKAANNGILKIHK